MKIAISAKKQIILNIVFALVAAMLLVWAGQTGYSRIESERSNRSVEICLDLDEILELCAVNNYPVGDFLERIKAIGVSSIALNEETLHSRSASGEIVYFSGSDYSRAKLLDLASQGGMVAANLIATQDQDVSDSLSDIIQTRYNVQVKSLKAGKYYLIYPAVPQMLIPVYWNDELPVGFSKDKIELLKSQGLKAVFNIQNSGSPDWITQLPLDNMSGILWGNSELSGFPAREDALIKVLEHARLKYIDMEFNVVPWQEYLKRNLPELLVRGHQILPSEIGHNSDQNFWISRWMRAIVERNIRFVYFHFWKNKPIEDNLDYLRAAAKKIKSAGFDLDAATPPSFPRRGSERIWILLSLSVAIIFPLVGLKYALDRSNPLVSFLLVNVFSIAGGILIGSILFDIYFLQKIIDVPYVRGIFFMPILLSVFLIFKPDELKKMWNSGLQVKHLLIGIFVIVAGIIIVIRSGNGSAGWMQPDQGLRQMLENLLLIRPRTKEFLIGQPLIFLGFYLKKPWLILFGMIGQVSIINTFMHVHSSLSVSLIRTFNGLWLGLLVGVILLELYKAVKNNIMFRKHG